MAHHVQKALAAWSLLPRKLRVSRQFLSLSAVIATAVGNSLTIVVLASCTMRALFASKKPPGPLVIISVLQSLRSSSSFTTCRHKR